MRICFKDHIIQEIARLIYEARQENREIDVIYLDKKEWQDLMNHFYGNRMTYRVAIMPRMVSVKEPYHIKYADEIHTHVLTRSSYNTEEVEFMGVKLRLEYK